MFKLFKPSVKRITHQAELKTHLEEQISRIIKSNQSDNLEAALQSSRKLSLLWTTLAHLDKQAAKNIKQLLRDEWAQRFDISTVSDHTSYGKQLDKFLKQLIEQPSLASCDLDSLISIILASDIEVKISEEPQQTSNAEQIITKTLALNTQVNFEEKIQEALAQFKAQEAKHYSKDWRKIEKQLNWFAQPGWHQLQLLGRTFLPRFSNRGNKDLYQVLYYLDIFYGRQTASGIIKDILENKKLTEATTAKAKFNQLNNYLIDCILLLQAREKLTPFEQGQLRQLKIALNHFSEKYQLDNCIKGLTTAEERDLLNLAPEDDSQQADTLTQREKLQVYQRLPRVSSSQRKKEIRRGKKIAFGLSHGLSGIVGPGQGLLSASGILQVLTTLANIKILPIILMLIVALTALPVAPLLGIALVSAVFIAGSVCNYMLFRQDLYDTLVDFFVKRNVFENLNGWQKALTVISVIFCLSAAIGFGILTGVAAAAVFSAFPIAIPAAAIATAAVLLGGFTAICCFGIFYRSWVAIFKSNLPATLKNFIKDNWPQKQHSFKQNIVGLLKFAAACIAAIVGTAIAVIASIATISVIQVAANQFATVGLTVLVNNFLANTITQAPATVAATISNIANYFSFGLALLSTPSQLGFMLKTGITTVYNLLTSVGNSIKALALGLGSIFKRVEKVKPSTETKTTEEPGDETSPEIKQESGGKIPHAALTAPSFISRLTENDFIYFLDGAKRLLFKGTMGSSILVNAVAMGAVESGDGAIASLGGKLSEQTCRLVYAPTAVGASICANAHGVQSANYEHKVVSAQAANRHGFFDKAKEQFGKKQEPDLAAKNAEAPDRCYQSDSESEDDSISATTQPTHVLKC